jgi:xeroderma pigmentosum group C-complementing protein
MKESAQGGFLTAADDVVQPFSLPKYQHLQLEPLAGPSNSEPSPVKSAVSELAEDSRRLTLEAVEYDDGDDKMEQFLPALPAFANDVSRAPKTMRELAADAPQPQAAKITSDSEVEVLDPLEKPVPRSGRNPRANGRSRGTRARPSRSSAQSKVSTPQPSFSRRSTRQVSRSRARDDDGESSELSEAEFDRGNKQPSRSRQPSVTSVVTEKRVLRPRKQKVQVQLDDGDPEDTGDFDD